MKPSTLHLVNQPLKNKLERDGLASFGSRASVPATDQWIRGRVVTLLSQYFVGATSDNVMRGIAADWVFELNGLPEWALQDACRWWMSKDNPQRKRKPLAGDISDRAYQEMVIVRAAKNAVEKFDKNVGVEL